MADLYKTMNRKAEAEQCLKRAKEIKKEQNK
jgi:hypothetical protein